MNELLTWVILNNTWWIINTITSNWTLDSNFVSIIFSLISIFLWLIMWIATYLISTSIPNIPKVADLEDIAIQKKVLQDITDLWIIKKSVQSKLKIIYISVILIPILLVILFYLKLNTLFLIFLIISIIVYLLIFIYVACNISKIIHLNLNLEWYQKDIFEKSMNIQ